MIKNIETKYKLMRFLAYFSIGSAIIGISTVSLLAMNKINEAHNSMWVLSNDIPLEATRSQSTVAEHRPFEYKGLVTTFHRLFYNITPDEKFLSNSIEEAMYFIDESGLKQHNTLKENGFYSALISTSSIMTIQIDSVDIQKINGIYNFKMYAKQKIERRSSTTERTLVTIGQIMDTQRSPSNPFGAIITNFNVIENNEISRRDKQLL